MNMNTLEKIRYLRFKHRFTQQIVADAIGVSLTTYSKYELGKINIPVEVLIKLSDFYDVSIDYLVGRSKTKNRMKRLFFLTAKPQTGLL